jgi:hypothetical protein
MRSAKQRARPIRDPWAWPRTLTSQGGRGASHDGRDGGGGDGGGGVDAGDAGGDDGAGDGGDGDGGDGVTNVALKVVGTGAVVVDVVVKE